MQGNPQKCRDCVRKANTQIELRLVRNAPKSNTGSLLTSETKEKVKGL